MKFLSTPSARRATGLLKLVLLELGISIHALRKEGDRLETVDSAPPSTFLSTPSARRATYGELLRIAQQAISIHALRKEGDDSRPRHSHILLISIHALRKEGDF